MFTLTGNILTKIAPSIQGQLAIDIAAWHTEVCPLYGIDTADILHEFLANELHESSCFTRLTEGLNYQAVALTKVFSRKRISVDDCYRYGRTMKQPANQPMIANIIYGGNWGKVNLGNIKPNDGYDFRGSGPIQITGRANITGFTKYYNKLTGSNHTPEAMASLLRADIKIGTHSACWIFAIAKGLIDEAIADYMTVIVKKINGGLLGLHERIKYYNLAKQFVI